MVDSFTSVKRLNTKEGYNFFDIASCITYDDIMYNELHDLNVKKGDVVMISYPTGELDLIKVSEVEYGDGTIWVKFLTNKIYEENDE